jgi:hypothetical protein
MKYWCQKKIVKNFQSGLLHLVPLYLLFCVTDIYERKYIVICIDYPNIKHHSKVF